MMSYLSVVILNGGGQTGSYTAKDNMSDKRGEETNSRAKSSWIIDKKRVNYLKYYSCLKRVSMGKRLLLLTIRILVILQLTVNPEIHKMIHWR